MILQERRKKELHNAEELLAKLKMEAEDCEKKLRIKEAYLQDEGYAELASNSVLRKAIENQVSCCGQQVDMFIEFEKNLQPEMPPFLPALLFDLPALPPAGRLGDSAEMAKFREEYHLIAPASAKFREEFNSYVCNTEFLSQRARDFAEKALQSNWWNSTHAHTRTHAHTHTNNCRFVTEAMFDVCRELKAVSQPAADYMEVCFYHCSCVAATALSLGIK